MSENKFKELSDLIRSVGDEILSYWPGRGNSNLKVWNKSNGTPVTEADIMASELLVNGIRKIYPEDGIISEELDNYLNVSSDRPVWILDPLDGTRSFIAGRNDFSILAGRCEGGRATLGIMYFPALNVFAWAEKGRGAYINGTKINVSEADTIDNSKVYCRVEGLEIGTYKAVDKLDSGRAFLGVARGEFDGAIIKIGHFGQHDFAAPSIIIEEAGGEISDEKGRKELFYPLVAGASGEPKSYNITYFIASNKRLHQSLLKLTS